VKSDADVGQGEHASSTSVISKDRLEVVPSDVIRTWGRDIRTGLKGLHHF